MSAIAPVTSAPVHQAPAVSPQSTQPARPVNPIQIDQLSSQGLSVSQIAQRLNIPQAAVTKDDGDADDAASKPQTVPSPSANTIGQTLGVTVNKTA